MYRLSTRSWSRFQLGRTLSTQVPVSHLPAYRTRDLPRHEEVFTLGHGEDQTPLASSQAYLKRYGEANYPVHLRRLGTGMARLTGGLGLSLYSTQQLIQHFPGVLEVPQVIPLYLLSVAGWLATPFWLSDPSLQIQVTRTGPLDQEEHDLTLTQPLSRHLAFQLGIHSLGVMIFPWVIQSPMMQEWGLMIGTSLTVSLWGTSFLRPKIETAPFYGGAFTMATSLAFLQGMETVTQLTPDQFNLGYVVAAITSLASSSWISAQGQGYRRGEWDALVQLINLVWKPLAFSIRLTRVIRDRHQPPSSW